MASSSPLAPSVPAPRSRPLARWFAFAAAGLVLLVLLGAAGGYAYARRSLPVLTGEVTLPGLRAAVTVYRDERGVPHIEASNEHDLYMAQGYVVAQDRLWQMDLTRRAASGRLSEVMGASQLKTDKFFRALNLRRAAEESVKAYRPETAALLEAYAAGVNAFINQAVAAGRLPVEFTLLGYKPEPWTPADSAIIGKIMAYDLGGNFAAEVYRLQLRQKVGIDLADQLLPVYPEDGITILDQEGASSTDGLRGVAADLPYVGGSLDLSGLLGAAVFPEEWVGSNNWVVSGRWTKSGKPLLANDPHLGVRTPSIWYEQHLIIPGQINAFGTMFPGAPGIVIGQNEKIAWGVTNTGPDVQDLYVERRNPENPYQFLFKGKYEDATVYKELIPVKGKEPVEFEVVVTRHGPIISEVVGDEKNRPQEALALKWTAHMGTPELEAVLQFVRAQNWSEFREALKSFQVPTQNFVFASVDGTIAYRAGGIIPIRARGNGLFPMPGWTGEYEWTGFIPFDEMPEVVNPAKGYIVTANNKVAPDSYPYLISLSWAQPYRAMRITEMIEAGKGSLTLEEMQSMQVDYANLHARTLLPVLLPAVEKAAASMSQQEQKALTVIKNWNQVDGAGETGPLVFHLWYGALTKLLYEPLMGEELYKRMSDRGNVTDLALLRAAKGEENDWIKQAGGLETLAISSFREAVKRAAALQGGDPAKWAWGKYHRIQPPHPIGGAVKPLGWVLNPKSYPVGGSGITVAQMSFGEDGRVKTSAPWRQVVDLADPTRNSRSIVLPGQSGHFLSPHYDDQSLFHNQGELFPRQFEAYTQGKKLVLKPSH
ncbi:MAG: penicillin acylase family protein [Bacillota bacterium]